MTPPVVGNREDRFDPPVEIAWHDIGAAQIHLVVAGVSEVMNIIGDVKGKSALLLDDMIDTAGTIVQAAKACADQGAREVWTACTHAVLSGPALERLQQSCITQVIATNTIPLREKGEQTSKIRSLSVAPLLAEAIRRIHEDESVSSLFT